MSRKNNSNLTKLLHIGSGFLLGQGSFFLVLSYLALCKEFEVIAQASLGLSVLSLCQWIADGGGTYLLRDVQRKSGTISSFIVIRLIQSIIVSILLVYTIKFFEFGRQFNDIANFSVVCAFAWGFNLTGIIDKSGQNKTAGPMSGLSWFASSLGLLFFYENDAYGTIMGVLFALGLIVTVFVHYILLKINLKYFLFNEIYLSHLKSDFKMIFFYNFNFAITQIYGRSLGFIVSYLLSTNTAGLFLYARSAANAVSQILLFSRRVEFDSEIQSFDIKSLLSVQKMSIMLSVLLTFGSLLSLTVSFLYGDEDFIMIFLYIFLALISLIFWNISNSISMVLVKFDLVAPVAVISLITIGVQLLFISASLPVYGIIPLFFSEMVLFCVQGLCFFYVLKKNLKIRTGVVNG